MKPLHEELKDIRLEKNISLEHIHEVTKIRGVLLEKLESGDTSFAPPPIIRAFLKEYAQAVGIDPDRVIRRYENKIDTIREASAIDAAPVTGPQPESPPPASDQPSEEIAKPETAEEETESPTPDKDASPVTSEDDTTEAQPEPAETGTVKIPATSELPESKETQLSSETEAQVAEEPPAFSKTESPKRVPVRRSRLEIEEPEEANKLAIAIFVIIIIIAAAIIFWFSH